MISPPSFHSKKIPFIILGDVCSIIGIEIPKGIDPQTQIEDLLPLKEALSNHLTCFHNTRYMEDLTKTHAGFCLILPKHKDKLPVHTQALVTENPYRGWALLGQRFYALHPQPLYEGISPHALIDPSARLGDGVNVAPFVVIGKNVVIEDHVTLGAHTVIHADCHIGARTFVEDHVVIRHAKIGAQAFIKSGARIGQSGFGFDSSPKGHWDIPQLGWVEIGDDVQIGSNTCIDRGSRGPTRIGHGVRIDNLVQIAHNVEIGDFSVIVAQVGISGSTRLGRFVVAAGQVGLSGHLVIGDGVQIAAQSGVIQDVASAERVGGTPAVPIRDWHKQTILLKNLVKARFSSRS